MGGGPSPSRRRKRLVQLVRVVVPATQRGQVDGDQHPRRERCEGNEERPGVAIRVGLFEEQDCKDGRRDWERRPGQDERVAQQPAALEPGERKDDRERAPGRRDRAGARVHWSTSPPGRVPRSIR